MAAGTAPGDEPGLQPHLWASWGSSHGCSSPRAIPTQGKGGDQPWEAHRGTQGSTREDGRQLSRPWRPPGEGAAGAGLL